VNLSTPLILTVLAVADPQGGRSLAPLERGDGGLSGVLLVIQPHAGDLNIWTWVALAGTVIGSSATSSRVICRPAFQPWSFPSRRALIVALVGCGWAVVEGWQPMDGRALGFIAASSLLLAIGYQFLVIALRSGGKISVIGAFRYGSILWALAIGYVVWARCPTRLRSAALR